jgi:hypothetical protein
MCAQTLSDDKIKTIMADPPLVWLILASDDTEMYPMKSVNQNRLDCFPACLEEKMQRYMKATVEGGCADSSRSSSATACALKRYCCPTKR